MSNYYVKRGEQIKGPFKGTQIQAAAQNGKLTDTDLIGKSAEGPWHAVKSIAALNVQTTPNSATQSKQPTAEVAGKNITTPSRGELSAQIIKAVSEGRAFHPGKYAVGVIPEGEYFCIHIESNTNYYQEKTRSETICMHRNLTFAYIYHHSVGEVITGSLMLKRELIEEFGFTSGKQLFEVHQDLPEYNFTGFYHVGYDVPPGRHSFKSVGNGSVTIYDGPAGNGRPVDIKTFIGSKDVELSAGKYVDFSGAKIVSMPVDSSTTSATSSQSRAETTGGKTEFTGVNSSLGSVTEETGQSEVLQSDTKVLTKEIAEQRILVDVYELMDLSEFTAIEDAAAESLSKHKGRLCLDGLTELSDAAAESLSKNKGILGSEGQLELGSLTELSNAAAESLSKHEGSLGLDGLTSLSDAAAESLSKHKGRLCLNGLTSLSDAAAESLSKCEGGLWKHHGVLFLHGLTELSDAAAESLSKCEGGLWLDGLTELSDAAAESLSKCEGVLWLDGLTSLSNAAAESLSKHEGQLELGGLTSLSNAAAESLSKHKGRLCLNGLTVLSDVAAESLSKCEGGLWLEGLTVLSDVAAESLGKYKGDLYLGLMELSDAAAESLSKCEGYLCLDDLTSLSAAAAESLAKHKDKLSLMGLTELLDAAAQSLAKKEPKFDSYYINLDNLPASAAQILRNAGHE